MQRDVLSFCGFNQKIPKRLVTLWYTDGIAAEYCQENVELYSDSGKSSR